MRFPKLDVVGYSVEYDLGSTVESAEYGPEAGTTARRDMERTVRNRLEIRNGTVIRTVRTTYQDRSFWDSTDVVQTLTRKREHSFDDACTECEGTRCHVA